MRNVDRQCDLAHPRGRDGPLGTVVPDSRARSVWARSTTFSANRSWRPTSLTGDSTATCSAPRASNANSGRSASRLRRRTRRSLRGRGLAFPYVRSPSGCSVASCRYMARWRLNMEKPASPRLVRSGARWHHATGPYAFRHRLRKRPPRRRQWRVGRTRGRKKPRPETMQKRSPLRFLHHAWVGGGLKARFSRVLPPATLADRYLGIDRCGRLDALHRIGVTCPGRNRGSPTGKRGVLRPRTSMAMQRGASSVYFRRVDSAIDIPPESNFSQCGGTALPNPDSYAIRDCAEQPDGPPTGPLAATFAMSGTRGVRHRDFSPRSAAPTSAAGRRTPRVPEVRRRGSAARRSGVRSSHRNPRLPRPARPLHIQTSLLLLGPRRDATSSRSPGRARVLISES